jgi:hypothetical protein
MPKEKETQSWSVFFRIGNKESFSEEKAASSYAAGLKTIARNKENLESFDITNIFHSEEVIDFEKMMKRREIERKRKQGGLLKNFILKVFGDGTIERIDE